MLVIFILLELTSEIYQFYEFITTYIDINNTMHRFGIKREKGFKADEKFYLCEGPREELLDERHYGIIKYNQLMAICTIL